LWHEHVIELGSWVQLDHNLALIGTGLALQYGNTAVNLAASGGREEVVAVLLGSGACIATADEVGWYD
jgi:hypothetical protein